MQTVHRAARNVWITIAGQLRCPIFGLFGSQQTAETECFGHSVFSAALCCRGAQRDRNIRFNIRITYENVARRGLGFRGSPSCTNLIDKPWGRPPTARLNDPRGLHHTKEDTKLTRVYASFAGSRERVRVLWCHSHLGWFNLFIC